MGGGREKGKDAAGQPKRLTWQSLLLLCSSPSGRAASPLPSPAEGRRARRTQPSLQRTARARSSRTLRSVNASRVRQAGSRANPPPFPYTHTRAQERQPLPLLPLPRGVCWLHSPGPLCFPSGPHGQGMPPAAALLPPPAPSARPPPPGSPPPLAEGQGQVGGGRKFSLSL